MITCLICLKKFKRITRTHLQHHNITTEEYRQMFPGTPIISDDLKYSYGKFFRENNPMKNVEIQKNFSILFQGRNVSESTRKKISKSKLGKKNWPNVSRCQKENWRCQ